MFRLNSEGILGEPFVPFSRYRLKSSSDGVRDDIAHSSVELTINERLNDHVGLLDALREGESAIPA